MDRLLVVVDFQNDFVTGSLGFEGAELLDEKIVEKVQNYRDHDFEVVATLDTHDDNYLELQEGSKLPIVHCKKGSEGWELFGKTGAALKEAKKFEKNTFGSVDLAEYLRENQFDTIEFVGLVTNMCVISNAIIAKAVQPEAEIIIDANCCSSFDLTLHDKTLDVCESMQISVNNRNIGEDNES